MGLLWNKPDPLSARARALNSEIAALEAQIKKLSSKIEAGDPQLRIRSTAHPPAQGHPAAPPLPPEPVFERVDHVRVKSTSETETTPAHFNDLGVRKYDLVAAWKRFLANFRGPPAGNVKLVSYLAAGSIQGLRPLRYEKRVARNRLLFLAAMLLAVLSGIIYVVMRR